MSFPSVTAIARAKGIEPGMITDEGVARDILREAIRTDASAAVDFLHQQIHLADERGKPITFTVDPNSSLGKQLQRLFAADVVRDLVRETFLHGREIAFYNCCSGIVPPKGGIPKVSAILQIQMQAGPIARADC